MMRKILLILLLIQSTSYCKNSFYLDFSTQGAGIGYEIPFLNHFLLHFGSVNSIAYRHYDYEPTRIIHGIELADTIEADEADTAITNTPFHYDDGYIHAEDTVVITATKNSLSADFKPFIGVGVKITVNQNILILSTVDVLQKIIMEGYTTYDRSGISRYAHYRGYFYRFSAGVLFSKLKMPIGISLDLNVAKDAPIEILPRCIIYL